MISLRDWNLFPKKIYESPNVVDNIQILITKEYVLSLEDVEFGVKQLTKGKSKDMKSY
jgi:hypothetical protein